MLRTRTFILFIFVAFITALAVWTTYLTYFPMHQIDEGPNIPDAVMEEVHAKIMNKMGNPKIYIYAPKLFHFKKDDTTKFELPHIEFYQTNNQPWIVNSKYALARDGMKVVSFWDNVLIKHTADENNPETTIQTEHLLVHPEQNKIETKDPITLIQPSTLIKAVGMVADTQKGDVSLLSQARGQYVPERL